MTRRAIAIAARALLPCAAGAARAQTATPAVPAVPAPHALRIDLRAEQGWESNVRFDHPGGADGAITRLGAGAAGTIGTPRTRLAAAARGDVAHYHQLSELDRATYGLVAGVTRTQSPRLGLQLGGELRTNLSRDVVRASGAADGEALPLLPLALSRTGTLAGAAAYRLSPTTDVRGEAGYARVSFDSPLLPGGSSVSGRAVLRRRYAPDDAYGLAYELQRGTMLGRSRDAHTLLAAWEPTLGALSARVRAGVLRLDAAPSPSSPHATVRGTGDAELRQRFARDVLAVRGGRSVGQAFGLGRTLVTDAVGVSYDHAAGAGLVLRLAADRSVSGDPADPALRYGTSGATLGVERAMPPGVTLGADVFLRRRTQQAAVSGGGVRFLVAYTGVRR